MAESPLNALTPVPSGMPLKDVVTSKRITAIQTAIRQLYKGENIQPGFGTYVRRTGDGYSVNMRRRLSGSGSSVIFPLQVVDQSTGSGSNAVARVMVRYATVGEIIPLIGETAISEEDDPPLLTLADEGQHLVYARCTVDTNEENFPGTYNTLTDVVIESRLLSELEDEPAVVSTFEEAILRIALVTVEDTEATEEDGEPGKIVTGISQEAAGSMQFVRFYGQFVFFPLYFVGVPQPAEEEE